jgi:hypothetical protein
MQHTWKILEINISLGNLKEREHLGGLDVNGRIVHVLKFISQEKRVSMWSRFIWSRIGPSCGICKYCDGLLSYKGGKILGKLIIS